MNKIPIKIEREVLNNFLDSYVLRKSYLKDTDWYVEYKKNSKAPVAELYRLRFSLWMADGSIFINKTIFSLLSLLPPALGLRIMHFLIKLKEKPNRS